MRRSAGRTAFVLCIFFIVILKGYAPAAGKKGNGSETKPVNKGKHPYYVRVGYALTNVSFFSTPPGKHKLKYNFIPPGGEKGDRALDFERRNQLLMYYAVSLQRGHTLEAARASFAAARSFMKERAFEQALYYYTCSLKLFRELKDRFTVPVCLTNIGLVHYYQNNLEKALTFYLEALKASEGIRHKLMTGINFGSIGNVYFKLGNYNKALEYHHRALEVISKQDQPLHVAKIFHNIANCHAREKRYPRAIRYYKKALAGVRAQKDRRGEAEELLGMAECYSARGDYAKALDYSTRSLRIARPLKDQRLICNNLYQVGLVQLSRTQYDRARATFKESLEIAASLDDKETMQNCNLKLSHIFEVKKQPWESLRYYKAYTAVKESLAPLEIRKRMVDIQLRYQSEKQQQTISALEKDNEIKNLRFSKKLLIRNLIIGGFVLLFSVVLFYARRYIAMLLFWRRQKYAGSYRLLEKIGSGGMGTVYKARSVARKSEPIAVKVLREELFNTPRGRERFEREAKIVSNFDHPNIVKMIEYGMHRDKMFIAMELLHGKDLAAEIKEKGRIDVNRAVSIACQIADALDTIHGHRFVHRDLKPANIMLVPAKDNPGHIKLLDFGLARGDAHNRLTVTGIIVGTLGYMPPEMVAESRFTAAGDIYALGVILYEMVTGERPFYARCANDMMRQIINISPTPPLKRRSGLPKRMDDLIMSMLEKEIENRPTAPVVLDILNELKYNNRDNNDDSNDDSNHENANLIHCPRGLSAGALKEVC